MSHIPNSAMPHAGAPAEPEHDDNARSPSLADRANKLADLARANPKTAAAAGAAVLAGAVAAAAIPLVRGRKSGSSGSKSKRSA